MDARRVRQEERQGRLRMAEYSFEEFKRIIERLRAKDGCPWDRVQTHASLRQAMLEECYEALEAIDRNDCENLKEELGDILLQIVMHSVIAEESGEFCLDDVIDGISAKMIRRHPHVFGTASAKDSEQVLENWEEIKKKEKAESWASEGILRIPAALPANVRAAKVLKKAGKAGLELGDAGLTMQRIQEGLETLARDTGLSEGAGNTGTDSETLERKFGELMLQMIHLSGILRINAENSLTKATNAFINRFVSVERLAMEEGRRADEVSAEELNDRWKRIM